MRVTVCLLRAVLLLVVVVGDGYGHGFLEVPKSRNVLFNSDYCPHCLNAGGPGATSKGDSWPNGRHGICGDPYDGPRKHEEGGAFFSDEPQATYTRGQSIELNVTLTANHHGRFMFRICRYSASRGEKASLTEACLNKNILKMADGEQMPGRPYYYTGPDDPPMSYTMRYRLPKSLTCDGRNTKCVLQWWWASMNSCILPDSPDVYRPSSNMGTCGETGTPEEFFNCSQVRIVGRGAKKPAGSSKPSPSASPSPRPRPSTPRPSPSPSPQTTSQTQGDGLLTSDAAEFCAKQSGHGYFQDPDSETGYYRCEETGSWAFECPSNTVFNPDLSVCDWA